MRRVRLTVPIVLLAWSSFVTVGATNAAASQSCVRSNPGVTVDNNWAWSAPGSWGMPGQQLTYAIDVRNYDIGCGSSSFAINVAVASGFAISMPTNTISLKSYSSGYLWAHVTSPSVIADGDYPLSVAVERAGSSSPSSPSTSYYKVYSLDLAAPTLFWPNPGDGNTLSGRSYTFTVSSSDDHAVKKIDLFIDNAYVSTTACDDISYTCQLGYKWSLRGASGQHTVTFEAYDWVGNLSLLPVTFTVS